MSPQRTASRRVLDDMKGGHGKHSPALAGADALKHYRVFKLGPNGLFADVIDLHAEGDDAAIRTALESRYPHGCEVWAGPRYLGRFYGPSQAK